MLLFCRLSTIFFIGYEINKTIPVQFPICFSLFRKTDLNSGKGVCFTVYVQKSNMETFQGDSCLSLHSSQLSTMQALLQTFTSALGPRNGKQLLLPNQKSGKNLMHPLLFAVFYFSVFVMCQLLSPIELFYIWYETVIIFPA